MRDRLKFHVTRHFDLRRAQRGFSLDSVKNVIKYGIEGKRLRRGTHGGIVKIFKKTAAGRTLVAVGEIRNNDCWLITAYYEN